MTAIFKMVLDVAKSPAPKCYETELDVRPIAEDSASAFNAVQDRTSMTRTSAIRDSALRLSSFGPQHRPHPSTNALPIAQFSLSPLPLIQMIRARAAGGSLC
jgi:hypothetical protein